jgi:hypothetical protein
LYKSANLKVKRNMLMFVVASLGFVLLVAALLLNMNWLHRISTYDYLLFQADRNKWVGYSFLDYSPTGKYSSMMAVQYLGWGFVLAGLIWASMTKLSSLRGLKKPKRQELEEQIFES